LHMGSPRSHNEIVRILGATYKPTNFMVALTSLMSELVNATIKFGMAPLELGPEFAASF
jgi:hypothetical protein